MEDKIIRMTMKIADAICDMDDIGFAEGLGPEQGRSEVWKELVKLAEHRACRICHRNRFKESFVPVETKGEADGERVRHGQKH